MYRNVQKRSGNGAAETFNKAIVLVQGRKDHACEAALASALANHAMLVHEECSELAAEQMREAVGIRRRLAGRGEGGERAYGASLQNLGALYMAQDCSHK